MEENFGGGNISEFGESSVICQTKTIQSIGGSINSPNFLSPNAPNESIRQTFPPYGIAYYY